MRLIDADALKIVAQGKNHHRRYIWADITDAPTIEAEPVKRGRWIDHGSFVTCSVCNEEQYGIDTGRFYCQNCGAKMDMKREDFEKKEGEVG